MTYTAESDDSFTSYKTLLLFTSSELLELWHVLSVSDEHSVRGVVRSNFVLFLEDGLNEAELGQASVLVSQKHDGNQREPGGVVSELGTLRSLFNNEVINIRFLRQFEKPPLTSNLERSSLRVRLGTFEESACTVLESICSRA